MGQAVVKLQQPDLLHKPWGTLLADSSVALGMVDEYATLAAAPAKLLDAARAAHWDEAAARAVARCTVESWLAAFPGHAERTAAYLNLYNAWTIHYTRPEHLASPRTRSKHFAFRQLPFARMLISFNELEHGLLRNGRLWWSLGYIQDPFAPMWQRILRLNRIDPRIHFALNCGARSCPPIRHYHANRLDAQLDVAAQHYLEQTVAVAGDALFLPRVFAWFPADFGGKDGMRRLLRKYNLPIKPDRWRYRPWNWDHLPQLPDPGPTPRQEIVRATKQE